MDMEKGFGFSGVVKASKDYAKAQAIIKLVNLGYEGLYVSFERNYAGKYLILHNGKWHCTDSDYYLSKEGFTDFGKDVDAFLKSAEEKNTTI